MRLAGQDKMGYYPTPPRVVELLRDLLAFPEAPFAALDPCCGTGEALALLVRGTEARSYGVEIHVGRYGLARGVLHRAALGAFEGSRVAMESFSLAFVNPPYDWEAGEGTPLGQRKERRFLWLSLMRLRAGGILVFIIPQGSLRFTYDMLARHLDNVTLMRFPDDEFSRFRQVVAVGIRRERALPQGPNEAELRAAARAELAELGDLKDRRYSIPPTPDGVDAGRVSPFLGAEVTEADAREALAQSTALTRFAELMVRARGEEGMTGTKRPPLPPHKGHHALLLAGGAMNGLVGSGPDAHVVKGGVRRVTIEGDTEETVERDGSRVMVKTTYHQYVPTVQILHPATGVRELAAGGGEQGGRD